MQEIVQKREQRLAVADMGKKHKTDIAQRQFDVTEYQAYCTFQVSQWEAKLFYNLCVYITNDFMINLLHMPVIKAKCASGIASRAWTKAKADDAWTRITNGYPKTKRYFG